MTKDKVIEFLVDVKKFFEPCPTKLPISEADFDRAIEAAKGGDFEPAEKLFDQAAGIFIKYEVEDYEVLCLEFLRELQDISSRPIQGAVSRLTK